MPPLDEVIVSPWTMSATVTSILHWNLIPIFADINEDDFCLDPKDVEKKISKRTKALVPVHYAGHPADMKALKKIAKVHDLSIVEDAATAVGTEYSGKKIGNENHSVCFSFHPIKNMTTGDGGMLTTNDKKTFIKNR